MAVEKNVQCLIDSDGDQIVGFESLERDGTYKLGPPVQQMFQVRMLMRFLLFCCSNFSLLSIGMNSVANVLPRT